VDFLRELEGMLEEKAHSMVTQALIALEVVESGTGSWRSVGSLAIH